MKEIVFLLLQLVSANYTECPDIEPATKCVSYCKAEYSVCFAACYLDGVCELNCSITLADCLDDWNVSKKFSFSLKHVLIYSKKVLAMRTVLTGARDVTVPSVAALFLIKTRTSKFVQKKHGLTWESASVSVTEMVTV